MPKTEEEFEKFLTNNKIDFKRQAVITNIPWSSKNTHKTDFLIFNKDHSETLYIEVKGFMTYEAVNILRYLLNNHKEYFYVVQITEEDWIEKYSKELFKSKSNKFKYNKEIMFNELLDFYNKKKSSKELNNLSVNYLNNYVKTVLSRYKSWIENY